MSEHSRTLVLALSRQQKIGAGVAAVLVLGWLIFIISTTRRTAAPGSEIELAPNRKPYLDDDALEGPKLTKALTWGLVLMGITAIGLPAYWLREPTRMEGGGYDRGAKWFDENSVEHGKNLYAAPPEEGEEGSRKAHFNCAQCHGAEGQGQTRTFQLKDPLNPDAPPRAVSWQCPPLDTITLRYRDDEIRNILVYGRPGTPMPAWGLKGGGPMNDQQINDLISYLHSISIGPDKAKAQAAAALRAARADAASAGKSDGELLFEGNCARCHTKGFSYGEPDVAGGGAFGPSLVGGSTLRQFPNVTDHVLWISETAELGKQFGVRGVSTGRMPHFNQVLTEGQIRAIVDYERGL
jgi:mono/diheme cytochrome c family protein